jgi:hypothetical protein
VTSFTQNLQFTKQATAENPNVWGSVLNGQIDLIDAAIAGAVSIDVTAANVSLSRIQGAADQSRPMTLLVVGTPVAARQIVVPTFQKVYTVHNACGQTVTVKTVSGLGVAIPTGTRLTVFVDEFEDNVFAPLLHGDGAVVVNPGPMIAIATTVPNATAGTSTPTFHYMIEGEQIVVSTFGFTVTVASTQFRANATFPVGTDLEAQPCFVVEAGVVTEAYMILTQSGVLFERGDGLGWTNPSSRTVVATRFTTRAP